MYPQLEITLKPIQCSNSISSFQIFPAFGAFTCFNRQTMSRRMSPMVLVIPVTSCFCKPNASACFVKSCKEKMHILTTRGVIDGQPSLTKTRKHTCPLPFTFTASHHRLTGVTNIVFVFVVVPHGSTLDSCL